MIAVLSEEERSLAFAEVALAQIKSLRQSAIPRNYEIWYVYATGINAALNNVVNETLKRNGRLSDADLDLIHETYLGRARSGDRIDKVGARVINEIDSVVHQLRDALGMTAAFNAKVTSAKIKLAGSLDEQRLISIVEQLLQASQDAISTNRTLEENLQSSRAEIAQLQDSLDAIRAESFTDPLTGLSNRKYFDHALNGSLNDARINGQPLSLLMLDIDYFKSFNDNYGHLTGDQILRLVGMTLRQTIKGQDITARFGGEEFAVLLPNTCLEQAVTVADNLRRAIMAKELKKKSTGEILGRITVSIGVATLRNKDNPDTFVGRSDACLYAAKRNGRNRVISETDHEYDIQDQVEVA